MNDPIRRFRYSLHPAHELQAKMIGNLHDRTGKTLAEWLDNVKRSRREDRRDVAAWLKSDHGLTTGFANLIAGMATGGEGPESYDPVREVENLFSGPRAALLGIYESLMDRAIALGADIRVCPCKTFVPIYRNHVIAQIKPTTRDRVDLGLALGDRAPEGRLVDTGGFAKKDRITHRIPITSPREIDADVDRWLKTAYNLDA